MMNSLNSATLGSLQSLKGVGHPEGAELNDLTSLQKP